MIDFKICRDKCRRCTFEPGEEMGVRPSVHCEVSGDVLLMNSDAPSKCPFKLEHKLLTQDVTPSFANYMSGCRRSDYEDKL